MVNHKRIYGLIKRYQRCWNQDTAYYRMIGQTIQTMDEAKSLSGYTRKRLIEVARHLLVPEGFVLCNSNLVKSVNDTRLSEHACEEIRIRMHKQMVSDNKTGGKGVYNRNTGELPAQQFRLIFNKVRININR